MSKYATRFHRDNSVTVWNVYSQQWIRLDATDLYADDKIMAALNERERAQVEARSHGWTLPEARGMVRHLWSLADDEGTIQAEDMINVASDPTAHTTCSVKAAAEKVGLGCTYRLMED